MQVFLHPAVPIFRITDHQAIIKDTRVKQAGPLTTARVFLVTIFWTAYYSSKSVYYGMFAKQLRPKIDQLVRSWSTRLVRPIDLDYRLEGDFAEQLIAGRPTIVMCNHSSNYDIPLSFVAFPGSIRMLAKKELFKIPLLSQAMTAAEFVSIDRQDKDQAMIDLKKAKAKMESGIILWIFPEGTRSTDGKLLPLKRGGFHLAIETGAIIIPVVFKNISDVLPGKSSNLRLGVTVEVEVGTAVDAADYSISERTELRKLISEQMLNMLGQSAALTQQPAELAQPVANNTEAVKVSAPQPDSERQP